MVEEGIRGVVDITMPKFKLTIFFGHNVPDSKYPKYPGHIRYINLFTDSYKVISSVFIFIWKANGQIIK